MKTKSGTAKPSGPVQGAKGATKPSPTDGKSLKVKGKGKKK